MNRFKASLYDGISAARAAVEVVILPGRLLVFDEAGEEITVPAGRLRVSPGTDFVSSRIAIARSWTLELPPVRGLCKALQTLSPPAHAPAPWLIFAAPFALLALWIALCTEGCARILAPLVPPAALRAAEQNDLQQIRREFLDESALPETEQNTLRQRFDELAAAAMPGTHLTLVFGESRNPLIGPNAFALRGTTVVILDSMVRAAPSTDALLGVFAHEIGHIANHHGARRMIEDSIHTSVLALISDGNSDLVSNFASTLGRLKQSRDAESEADEFAAHLLRTQHFPVEPYARLLFELDKAQGSGANFLSTHPGAEDRVQRMKTGLSVSQS